MQFLPIDSVVLYLQVNMISETYIFKLFPGEYPRIPLAARRFTACKTSHFSIVMDWNLCIPLNLYPPLTIYQLHLLVYMRLCIHIKKYTWRGRRDQQVVYRSCTKSSTGRLKIPKCARSSPREVETFMWFPPFSHVYTYMASSSEIDCICVDKKYMIH